MQRVDRAGELESERDNLRRELIGVQEMLAWVLFEVGEPVRIDKDKLANGLPEGTQIAVDDDLAAEQFVFSLVEAD